MGVTGLRDSHVRVLAVLIQTVYKAYASFYQNKTPIPTPLLEQALRLQENSFEFNGKNYLQTHGTAMGTKWQSLSPTSLWRKLKQTFLAKAYETARLETFHRRRFLTLGHITEKK